MQIVKRLGGICRAEGLEMTESALMALVEGGNCDIRLIMGQLQMIRLRARTLSYDEAKVGSQGYVHLFTRASHFI